MKKAVMRTGKLIKSVEKSLCFRGMRLLGLLLILLLGFGGGSSALADVIIDNGASGTSSTGSWAVSGGLMPYANDSLWARDGATYTWQFSGEAAGIYRVHAWWSTWPSRAAAVDARIIHAGGEASLTLDQSQNGGTWNNLGSFLFNGSGSLSITAASGSTLSTSADAVWFEFVSANTPPVASIDVISPNAAMPGEFISFAGSAEDAEGEVVRWEWSSNIVGVFGTLPSFSTASLTEGRHLISLRVEDNEGAWSEPVTMTLVVGTPADEIIIDNRDPQTASTGIWAVSGAPNYYGADSVWSRDGATFSWIFTPPKAGDYRVSIRCTQWPSRSTSVPVLVNYAGGSETHILNQQLDGGIWKDLGLYPFDINGGGSVNVTAQTGSSSTCADAVRFQFELTNALPEAVIDSIAPSPALLGEEVTLSGHGNDRDGEILAWSWESNISGLIGDQPEIISNLLPEALHLISFKVQDNAGAWSDPATFELKVGNPPNLPPVATISEISPNPALVDEAIQFVGAARDADGSVTSYRWWSDVDGLLSESASFTSSALSLGVHEISFQAFDDLEATSNLVTQTLNVETSATSTIIDNSMPGISSTGVWAASSAPGYYGSESLWSRNGATYSWTFTPEISGIHEAFIWYTQWPSRATNVPLSLETASGVVYREINQQVNGGQWNSLGEFLFEVGQSYRLSITAAGSVASTSADAVRFVHKTTPGTPSAEFRVDKQLGGAPLLTKFTDLSLGAVTDWYWSFGDGGSSTEQHPEYKYQSPGLYTVSLTVSNTSGSDLETKTGYVTIAGGNTENIYLCEGYASSDYFMVNMNNLFRDLQAQKINGVWVYTNSQKGITYYMHHVHSPDAMERAMREEGAHILFDGHSNFGLGATFATAAEIEAQQINDIYYIDDDRITNYSTDMVSLKIDGMKYGQAYPNWDPVFKNGQSGVMPYTFDEGIPPYNYYLSYQIPGDPETYKIELSDGRYLERFPDSSTPAWFSSDGLPPDPLENPEYFITNYDQEYNRADFTGAWPLAKVPNAGYMGDAGYLGYNYQVMPAGNGSNNAVFTILIDHPGVYVVMASWFPAPQNASNAKFVVNHAGGSTTVTVDQRTTVLTNLLGVYQFNEGAYTVELSDDANGNVIADAIILQYANDPDGVLQAEFNAEIHSGSAPLAVNFKDLSQSYSATNLELKITGWLWDFGDGTTSTLQNPTHTYSAPGIYPVSLSVTDSAGNYQLELKQNFVVVETPAPLEAEFSATHRMGANRTVTRFIDQSSGNPTSWLWDFGDGTTSSEQNPTHLYLEQGRSYPVSLSVTGPGGSDVETEVDFVYNMVGVNYVDNTFHTKPHFYSGSLIRFGKVIINTGNIKIQEEDLKYARFFYSGCNSANYFIGTLHRGIMIFTTADVHDEFSSTSYLKYYLKGFSDQINMMTLLQMEPIWEYYDFNQKPPSQR